MLRKSKILSLLLCFCLLFEQTGFAQVAGALDISGHIAAFCNSLIQDKFRPLHLRSLGYDNSQNNFRLLLDKGDLKNPKKPELETTTKTLLNYFFVGITLPNDTFWVNLRPDSENNIIDPDLVTTDVGKILLEADLQLKKDTAKFTSPETPEGKEYWEKLYQKAGELLGYENITIPTLTRPWIVPGEIIIRETKDNAYIYKATLKVMLEQDYLKDSATYDFSDPRLKTLNEYSSELIRELIIPKLTKEVNTSKRYAPLRQVYYSLILAQWFKARFYGKGGLYSWLIDRRELRGLTSKTSWSKTTYFKAYQKSFKDGEYNIKQPISTPYGQTIRSYFSGGFNGYVSIPAPPTSGIATKATNGPTEVYAILGNDDYRPSSELGKTFPALGDGGDLNDLSARNVNIEEASSPSGLPAEGLQSGASSAIKGKQDQISASSPAEVGIERIRQRLHQLLEEGEKRDEGSVHIRQKHMEEDLKALEDLLKTIEDIRQRESFVNRLWDLINTVDPILNKERDSLILWDRYMGMIRDLILAFGKDTEGIVESLEIATEFITQSSSRRNLDFNLTLMEVGNLLSGLEDYPERIKGALVILQYFVENDDAPIKDFYKRVIGIIKSTNILTANPGVRKDEAGKYIFIIDSSSNLEEMIEFTLWLGRVIDSSFRFLVHIEDSYRAEYIKQIENELKDRVGFILKQGKIVEASLRRIQEPVVSKETPEVKPIEAKKYRSTKNNPDLKDLRNDLKVIAHVLRYINEYRLGNNLSKEDLWRIYLDLAEIYDGEYAVMYYKKVRDELLNEKIQEVYPHIADLAGLMLDRGYFSEAVELYDLVFDYLPFTTAKLDKNLGMMELIEKFVEREEYALALRYWDRMLKSIPVDLHRIERTRDIADKKISRESLLYSAKKMHELAVRLKDKNEIRYYNEFLTRARALFDRLANAATEELNKRLELEGSDIKALRRDFAGDIAGYIAKKYKGFWKADDSRSRREEFNSRLLSELERIILAMVDKGDEFIEDALAWTGRVWASEEKLGLYEEIIAKLPKNYPRQRLERLFRQWQEELERVAQFYVEERKMIGIDLIIHRSSFYLYHQGHLEIAKLRFEAFASESQSIVEKVLGLYEDLEENPWRKERYGIRSWVDDQVGLPSGTNIVTTFIADLRINQLENLYYLTDSIDTEAGYQLAKKLAQKLALELLRQAKLKSRESFKWDVGGSAWSYVKDENFGNFTLTYRALKMFFKMALKRNNPKDALWVIERLEGLSIIKEYYEQMNQRDLKSGKPEPEWEGVEPLNEITRIIWEAETLMKADLALWYSQEGRTQEAKDIIQEIVSKAEKDFSKFDPLFLGKTAIMISKAEVLVPFAERIFELLIAKADLDIENSNLLTQGIEDSSDFVNKERLHSLFVERILKQAKSRDLDTQEEAVASLLNLFNVITEKDKYPQLKSQILEAMGNLVMKIRFDRTKSRLGILVRVSKAITKAEPTVVEPESITALRSLEPNSLDLTDELNTVFPKHFLVTKEEGEDTLEVVLRKLKMAKVSEEEFNKISQRIISALELLLDGKVKSAEEADVILEILSEALHQEILTLIRKMKTDNDYRKTLLLVNLEKAKIFSYLWEKILKKTVVYGDNHLSTQERKILDILLEAKTQEVILAKQNLYVHLFKAKTISLELKDYLFERLIEGKTILAYLTNYYQRNIRGEKEIIRQEFYSKISQLIEIGDYDRPLVPGELVLILFFEGEESFQTYLEKYQKIKNVRSEFWNDVDKRRKQGDEKAKLIGWPDYYKYTKSKIKNDPIAIDILLREQESGEYMIESILGNRKLREQGNLTYQYFSDLVYYLRDEHGIYIPGEDYYKRYYETQFSIRGKGIKDVPPLTEEQKVILDVYLKMMERLGKDLHLLILEHFLPKLFKDPKGLVTYIFRRRFGLLDPEKRILTLARLQEARISRSKNVSEAQIIKEFLILGGIADIKVGQILSTRRDLLSEEYRKVLAELTDEAPAVSFGVVLEVLKETFGEIIITEKEAGKSIRIERMKQNRKEVLFETFYLQPLAIGSVAQVHLAILPDGKKVVVKVIKPGLIAELETGLKDWLEIAEGLKNEPRFPIFVQGGIDLAAMFKEYFRSVKAETDLRVEAENIRTIGRNLIKDSDIFVPIIYTELSGEKVLTLSFVSGKPIDQIQDGRGREIAQRFMKEILREVFELGIFHADPHRGNVFVDNADAITLIDMGMIGRLKDIHRDTILELLYNLGVLQEENKGGLVGKLIRVVRGDSLQKVIETLKKMGHLTKDFNEENIRKAIEEIFSGETGRDLKGFNLVSLLLRAAGENGIQIDSAYTIMLKALYAAEGVVHTLDPEHNLAEAIKPIVLEYQERQKKPSRPASRRGYYGYSTYPASESKEDKLTKEEKEEVRLLIDNGVIEPEQAKKAIEILRRVSPLGRALLKRMEETNIPILLGDKAITRQADLLRNIAARRFSRAEKIVLPRGLHFFWFLKELIHETSHAVPLLEGIDFPEIDLTKPDEILEKDLLYAIAFDEAISISAEMQLWNDLIEQGLITDDDLKEISAKHKVDFVYEQIKEIRRILDKGTLEDLAHKVPDFHERFINGYYQEIVRQFISLKDKYDTQSVLGIFPQVIEALERKISNGQSLADALQEVGQDIMPTINAFIGKAKTEELKIKARSLLDSVDKVEEVKEKLTEAAKEIIHQEGDMTIIDVNKARQQAQEVLGALFDNNKDKEKEESIDEKKESAGSPIIEQQKFASSAVEKAKEYAEKFIEKFGAPDVSFGGVKELSNPKARAEIIDNKIYLNSLWLDKMTEDEIERVVAHEVQHTRTDFLRDEKGLKIGGLHKVESFQELQQRIGDSYDKTIQEKGNVFAKPRNQYQENWEVLSLLRGYEIYREQIERGLQVTTQPYEFIEAFTPKDLDFLNEDYLFEITKDFEPEVGQGTKITYEDLGYLKEPETNSDDKSVASSSISDKKGGVDFRALPIVTQPINTHAVNLNAMPLGRLNNINLDSEWSQIRNMLNAGIIPSSERIKEYVLACCLRQGLGNQMDKVLGCIADIMRMEEDRVSDADAELKDMLVLIEAGKPESELQLGLSQIIISPKEPKLVVP